MEKLEIINVTEEEYKLLQSIETNEEKQGEEND